MRYCTITTGTVLVLLYQKCVSIRNDHLPDLSDPRLGLCWVRHQDQTFPYLKKKIKNVTAQRRIILQLVCWLLHNQDIISQRCKELICGGSPVG